MMRFLLRCGIETQQVLDREYRNCNRVKVVKLQFKRIVNRWDGLQKYGGDDVPPDLVPVGSRD